jgi:hypothetical protein
MIKENDIDKGLNGFKYTRLFFDSCNVERYFLEALTRGVVFYSKGVTDGIGTYIYLDSYLKGKTDSEIYEILERNLPSLYYYQDFTKPCQCQDDCLMN